MLLAHSRCKPLRAFALAGDPGALAGRADLRGVSDQVIDVVFQLGAPHLQLFDFLVGSEIDFLFDAIDGVIEPMVFVKEVPEVVIGALEAPDGFTMFRKLTHDRMMEVHGRF